MQFHQLLVIQLTFFNTYCMYKLDITKLSIRSTDRRNSLHSVDLPQYTLAVLLWLGLQVLFR